jgi:predicted transcriptional regulator
MSEPALFQRWQHLCEACRRRLEARVDNGQRTTVGHAPTAVFHRRRSKTAVSIPDDVFEKVERLARRGQRSRSEVFSAALAEYVARHAPDEVTDVMNRVCADVAGQDVQPDDFVRTAGRRVLEKTEW